MSDCDSEGPSSPKKTKKGKHIKQKYRQQWARDDVFKDWIAPVDGDLIEQKCVTKLEARTSTH